jgi:hypothetical protein
MHIAYLDESGCPGALPNATSLVQPVLSLLAMAITEDKLSPLTRDFVQLKKRFFPKASSSPHALDAILGEIKGAELSKEIRLGNRNKYRHHLLFLGRLLSLIEQHEGKLFGRIYIKPVGGAFDGTAVYTSAVQGLCVVFHNLLTEQATTGFIVADAREQKQNTKVSHSVFTEKFRFQGDKYPQLVEMPLFGHSDNHAGIQICDLLNSAIIYPIACHIYCTGIVTHVHVDPAFAILKTNFGQRLKNLQYRFQDGTGRWKGGLTVIDPVGHRSASLMF